MAPTKDDTKTLDDLTKDRFNRQQGLKEQQTSRYTTTTQSAQEQKPTITSSIGSGFDYSYSPAPIPSSKKDIASTKTDSIEKTESKKNDTDLIFGDKPISSGKKHEFKRELSDADIIFGGGTDPPKTYSTPTSRYAYNKSNSAFSTSVSSDSDYIYGPKARDSSFSKSLSVSSEKDGDFSHDPSVIASRNIQGITNDAFSDFDSPKSTASTKRWTDDDDFDLK